MDQAHAPRLRRVNVCVTWRCNLSCSHCLQSDHQGGTDIPVGTFESILKEASSLGARIVALTGGEATLHRSFLDLIRIADDHGFDWCLTTNGMATKRILRACRIRPAASVTVSLDGHDQSSHEAVRGPGTFIPALRSVSYLSSAGLPVSIQATLVKPLIDQLDPLLQLARGVGAGRLVLAWPIPTPDLAKRGALPNHAELTAVKAWAQQRRPASDPQVRLSFGANLLAALNAPPTPCSYLHGEEVFVDRNGAVSWCCQTSGVGKGSAEVIGQLSENSLAALFATSHRAHQEFLHQAGRKPASPGDALMCHRCLSHLGKTPQAAAGRA